MTHMRSYQLVQVFLNYEKSVEPGLGDFCCMTAMFGRGLDKVGRQHEQAEQITVKKGTTL